MNAQELLTLYQTMSMHHSLPAMEPKTWDLRCDIENLDTAAAVMELVKKFNPTTGWLGFQSTTKIFKTNKELPVMNETTGTLLNAEMANALGQSLHVRYDSAGNWIITKFTPTIGSNYLVDNVKFIIHHLPDNVFMFKRYWRLDAEQGIVPDTACFNLIT